MMTDRQRDRESNCAVKIDWEAQVVTVAISKLVWELKQNYIGKTVTQVLAVLLEDLDGPDPNHSFVPNPHKYSHCFMIAKVSGRVSFFHL